MDLSFAPGKTRIVIDVTQPVVVESAKIDKDAAGYRLSLDILSVDAAMKEGRKAFAAKLDEMIEMMAEQLPELPRKVARRRAMAALSTMAGALVLARIAGTGEFSEEILDSGREAALAQAGQPAAKARRARDD